MACILPKSVYFCKWDRVIIPVSRVTNINSILKIESNWLLFDICSQRHIIVDCKALSNVSKCWVHKITNTYVLCLSQMSWKHALIVWALRSLKNGKTFCDHTQRCRIITRRMLKTRIELTASLRCYALMLHFIISNKAIWFDHANGPRLLLYGEMKYTT